MRYTEALVFQRSLSRRDARRDGRFESHKHHESLAVGQGKRGNAAAIFNVFAIRSQSSCATSQCLVE